MKDVLQSRVCKVERGAAQSVPVKAVGRWGRIEADLGERGGVQPQFAEGNDLTTASVQTIMYVQVDPVYLS